jgi:tRNA(Arg) A34 adenosine deaminase TadA
VKAGNHPFGALLVLRGQVVAEAQNTVNSEQDLTCHAELNLLSELKHKLSAQELSEAVLYASTEPCAMCAGALVWSGIRHLVYGCSALDLNRIAGGSFAVECREIFSHSTEIFQVTGPLLAQEAQELHQDYWYRS